MIFDWISFYFIFLRNNKKKYFPLWHLIYFLKLKKKQKKNLEREKDMIHEKIQKNRKCSKKRYYFQQQLESHFWPKKRWNLIFSISEKVVENWISFWKTQIPNKFEFWEESYSQNTKQVHKITQIQHHLQFSFKISNGVQHQICSSLSNRLIPSLSFRRKLLKNKLDRKTDTFLWKISKNRKMLKKRYYFQQ